MTSIPQAEVVNRDQSRVRMRALRERRKAEFEAHTGKTATRSFGFKTVWTPAETEHIKACLAKGMRLHQIVVAIPTKNARQIGTKIQSMGQSAKHTDGMTPHGGGGMKPISKPSPALIEERDDVLNADYAGLVHLDPNISVLGDPSPARRALLDRRRAAAAAKEASRRPTLSMSAVPLTRLGETVEAVRLDRMGLSL